MLKLFVLPFLLLSCNSKNPIYMYRLEYKNGTFRIDNNARCELSTFDEKYKRKWCQKVDLNYECEDAEGNKVSFREFQVQSMCESAISMKKREGVDLKD